MIKYKNRDIFLSASVMCANWLNLKKDIDELCRLKFDYLHIDIIDGKFAPDFTMGSSIINLLKENYDKMKFDYHFMVEEPSYLIDNSNFNKNDIVSIHQECSRNLHRDISALKKKNVSVGCALSPATSLESLEYLLDDLDVVVLMTVNPGYKGQDLVPQMLRKINQLRNIIDKRNLNTKISVDGSVNNKSIKSMLSNGADILVLGSSGLFIDGSDLNNSYESIIKLINE